MIKLALTLSSIFIYMSLNLGLLAQQFISYTVKNQCDTVVEKNQTCPSSILF